MTRYLGAKSGRLPIGFCSPECIRRPSIWYRGTR